MKKVLALVLSMAMSLSMVTFAAAAVVDTKPVDQVVKGQFNPSYGAAAQMYPGNTYYFSVEDAGKNILNKNTTVKANWEKVGSEKGWGGAMVDKVSIKKKEEAYYVAIALNENYTLVDLKTLYGVLTLKNTDKGDVTVTLDGRTDPNFNVANDICYDWVGYSKIADSEDEVWIVEDNTVYEIDGSGWVTFGAENRLAQITAKFSDGEKIFAFFNETVIDAVLDKYDDGEAVIDFIRFVAKPQLRKTSTVTFDRGFTKQGYIYEWDGKSLTEIKDAKWSSEDGTWTITTNKLGDYVFSDQKLIASTTTSESSDAGTTTEPNPGTGANDFVGLAVALAVVSVAGIAVAKRK